MSREHAQPCPGESCLHCPACHGRSRDGGLCPGCVWQAEKQGVTPEQFERYWRAAWSAKNGKVPAGFR